MLRLKKYPKRSPYWLLRGTVAGVEVNETTGTTDRAKAEAYLKHRYDELYNEHALKIVKVTPCTFADAVEVYINKGGEKKYLPGLLMAFGDMPLGSIGQAEIDKEAAKRFPNAKASTINRSFINPFITVARAAIKAELPGAKLRPIQRRKEQKPIVTPATDEHIEKLLPHCSEGLRALILLMTYTGLRTGEALRVKAEDCRDGYIEIAKTKNGESRMVPCPAGWSWPTGGFGFITTQGVGRALRHAHKVAGLVYRDGHELGRHAFSARWLGSGESIKGLKEAGGWKKLAVVDQSYGHLEQTDVHLKMRELSKKRAKPVQM